MPWILLRHFVVELGKVLLLTTAVIVVVVAFGAVIKPLAGNLLGPGGILKYILLAMVPMLQYALPFSAGFAATIVTHRFASDNEIQAMSASGISYKVILLPQIALGLVLTLFMFVLVQSAIPRFLGLMSDVITHDAAQVFVSTIRSGEAFRSGNFLIYADRISMEEASDGPSLQRVRMEGVAAIELDGSGRLGSEFVARSGSADLYSIDSNLVIKVAFRDATILRPGEATVAFLSRVEPTPTVIDCGWERSPKYLPWSELIEVVQDPSKGALVAMEEERLAAALAPGILIDRLGKQVDQSGRGSLLGVESGRTYEVRDAMLGGTGLLPRPPAKRLTVVESVQGVGVREASATAASLSATSDSLGMDGTGGSAGDGSLGEHRVDLTLIDPRARSLTADGEREVNWPARIGGLTVAPGGEALAPPSLLDEAKSLSQRTLPPLDAFAAAAKGSVARMEGAIQSTYYEAISHVWMRFAQPFSVLLMLVLGGVLAIWKRNSLPLTIYLLAFLPAIANVLLIASGQSILRSSEVGTGLLVMWAGNLLLLGAIIAAGRVMARR